MGDGLKLSKDKRHRSSSSIAGVAVEGTRSERKLEIRGSIPEADDQFTLADARCDDLQEKINLVKVMKRKRKLKKRRKMHSSRGNTDNRIPRERSRSTTRVNEPPAPPENVPFITVRTQPKKKVIQARLHRLETAPNPVRGYVDPVTVEQHRMLGHVRGYNQFYTQPHESKSKNIEADGSRAHTRRARADGDTIMYGRSPQINTSLDMGTGATDADFSDNDVFDQRQDNYFAVHNKKPVENCQQQRILTPTHRRRVTRDAPGSRGSNERIKEQEGWRLTASAAQRRRQQKSQLQNIASAPEGPHEDRPVVELFNKSRDSSSPSPFSTRPPTVHDTNNKKVREAHSLNDQTTGTIGDESVEAVKKRKDARHVRKMKYRSRRYELPTVASQMKQAGVRYYYGNGNQTNIPFIVSKSTTPSHNIGVNLQQVLNGLKIQQPLSGIPATIAHHMGLGHIPFSGAKSAIVQPSSEDREMNAIKLGRRLVRLPSYKYMSYNRMLNLYREGDGMVPRFLRAISRPHYFYTSMYNLATNHEDLDGATSKGHGGSQAAKQSLAEYAGLYREYEQLEKCLKEGEYEPEWERRRDELSRELAVREEHIRRVVQDYRTPTDAEPTPLRASISTAGEGYRRNSTYKLHLDPQQ